MSPPLVLVGHGGFLPDKRSTLVTGGEYNNQYHILARIRDDKLRLLREYIDTKYTDATLGIALAKLQSSK